MRLVEQWRRIGSELPAGWAEARLALTLPRSEQRERAASLLSPASPGRVGETFHFSVRRSGGGIGPDQCTKLLGKLDAERIRGTLAPLETVEREVHEESPSQELAVAWAAGRRRAASRLERPVLRARAGLERLPRPGRAPAGAAESRPRAGRSAFRFRVAQSFGYGASPQMTARCLERVDAEGITGRLTILRALSDTHNVATQGPVWRVEGKAV